MIWLIVFEFFTKIDVIIILTDMFVIFRAKKFSSIKIIPTFEEMQLKSDSSFDDKLT